MARSRRSKVVDPKAEIRWGIRAIILVVVVIGLFVGMGRCARASAYSDAIMALTPTAYYRLDESSGTSLADFSGNGHTATITSTNRTLGRASLVMDSDTSIAVFTTNLSPLQTGFISPPTGGWPSTITAWTMVEWVHKEGSNAQLSFFDWGCTQVGQNFTGTNTLNLFMSTSCTTHASLLAGVATVSTSNYMVAVTKGDPTSQGFWLNGSRVTTSIPANDPAPNTNASGIGIGTPGGGAYYYCGLTSCNYDEVAYFNRALSPPDLANLYVVGSTGAAAQSGSFLGAW